MQRLKFCFSGTYQLMGTWISGSLQVLTFSLSHNLLCGFPALGLNTFTCLLVFEVTGLFLSKSTS